MKAAKDYRESCEREIKKCCNQCSKRKVENLQNCEQYPAYAGVMLFYFVRWLKQHDVKMEMF